LGQPCYLIFLPLLSLVFPFHSF